MLRCGVRHRLTLLSSAICPIFTVTTVLTAYLRYCLIVRDRTIAGENLAQAPAAAGCAAGGRTVVARRLADFTRAGYDKGRGKLWQAAWFAVMNLVFMAWWCPVRLRPVILRAFGATIGRQVFIRHRVRVLWPWKLTIGDNCWIGEGVWLLNLEPITIDHDVCISQEALLCTGSHAHRDPAFEYDNGPIHVGAGAWIATRATVLRRAVVVAGEVVPAGSVRSAQRPRRS
jgi:putative colanic acid biosynthesis acetyltransferase WcaF